MSSDSTGEIFVLTKADGTGVADVRGASANGSSPSPSPSGSGSAPSPSPSNSGTSSAVKRWSVGSGSYWIAGAAIAGALPMM